MHLDLETSVKGWTVVFVSSQTLCILAAGVFPQPARGLARQHSKLSFKKGSF